MAKDGISIVVRIVERPKPVESLPGQAFQPPKATVYKAIATCEIKGKRYSRTSAKPTEVNARMDAYSKLASLVAKQGAVPVQGHGVVIDERNKGKKPS